jgi:hypothetical protein
MKRSGRPETDWSGRNRGLSRRSWRRNRRVCGWLELSRLDSFGEDGEDDEADLLVSSARRGAALSGGAMARWRWWCEVWGLLAAVLCLVGLCCWCRSPFRLGLDIVLVVPPLDSPSLLPLSLAPSLFSPFLLLLLIISSFGFVCSSYRLKMWFEWEKGQLLGQTLSSLTLSKISTSGLRWRVSSDFTNNGERECCV